MPPKTLKTPFQVGKEHHIMFGLKILEETNGVVSLVKCQFCDSFGRETKTGQKRKRTSNAALFRAPFRTDMYRRHLETSHSVKWAEYQQLSRDEKISFFPDNYSLGSHPISTHPLPTNKDAMIRTLNLPSEVSKAHESFTLPTVASNHVIACIEQFPGGDFSLTLKGSNESALVQSFKDSGLDEEAAVSKARLFREMLTSCELTLTLKKTTKP